MSGRYYSRSCGSIGDDASRGSAVDVQSKGDPPSAEQRHFQTEVKTLQLLLDLHGILFGDRIRRGV